MWRALAVPTTLGHGLRFGLMLPWVGAGHYLLPQRSQT